MELRFETPTPLGYFANLVRTDSEFALFEAAVSLAQDDYPELDVESVLESMDQLLARLKRRIPADAGSLHKLKLLNHFFFKDLGFGENANNFYDPENSYIHVLLDRRRGIPISLAILWLELAQGIGLSVRGIGFPGHFLMKVNLPKGYAIIDPLTGGSFSAEGLSELLEPYRSGETGEFEVPLELYLQSATPRDMIGRMLGNLKEIYYSQTDWPRLLAVQERLVVLFPEAWIEVRDRGFIHAELGHYAEAVADLETYLSHGDGIDDAESVAQRVDVLRSYLD